MIPHKFAMVVLALGAVLLLVAVLGGMLLPSATRRAPGRIARTAIAVGGVALMVWAWVSYLPPRSQPAPAPPTAAPATLSARDLVGTASTSLEACPLPPAPSVPDSARASLDEMKAARAAFAAYDAATNTYTQCVDATIARTARQFAGVASEADLQALNAFGANAHNAAIDHERAIVDQFNVQLRAYNTKHPK